MPMTALLQKGSSNTTHVFNCLQQSRGGEKARAKKWGVAHCSAHTPQKCRARAARSIKKTITSTQKTRSLPTRGARAGLKGEPGRRTAAAAAAAAARALATGLLRLISGAVAEHGSNRLELGADRLDVVVQALVLGFFVCLRRVFLWGVLATHTQT
jgi:hypothetical protein